MSIRYFLCIIMPLLLDGSSVFSGITMVLSVCYVGRLQMCVNLCDNLGGINEPCPFHPQATVSINQVPLQEPASKGCGVHVLSIFKFNYELAVFFWEK